jgi:hypothetical protein
MGCCGSDNIEPEGHHSGHIVSHHRKSHHGTGHGTGGKFIKHVKGERHVPQFNPKTHIKAIDLEIGYE